MEKCSPLDSEQILTEAEKLQLQVFRSFDERNRPDFLSFENSFSKIIHKIENERNYLLEFVKNLRIRSISNSNRFEVQPRLPTPISSGSPVLSSILPAVNRQRMENDRGFGRTISSHRPNFPDSNLSRQLAPFGTSGFSLLTHQSSPAFSPTHSIHLSFPYTTSEGYGSA